MTQEDRVYFQARIWYFDDPPHRRDGTLDLTNGAGEDFLYMHRRMIQMVKDVYDTSGVSSPDSWKRLPLPTAAQFSYRADDTSQPPKYVYDPEA